MMTFTVTCRRLSFSWRQSTHLRPTTIEAESQEAAIQEAERRCGAHEELVAVRTTTREASLPAS